MVVLEGKLKKMRKKTEERLVQFSVIVKAKLIDSGLSCKVLLRLLDYKIEIPSIRKV
jgi:hypothetical protein